MSLFRKRNVAVIFSFLSLTGCGKTPSEETSKAPEENPGIEIRAVSATSGQLEGNTWDLGKVTNDSDQVSHWKVFNLTKDTIKVERLFWGGECFQPISDGDKIPPGSAMDWQYKFHGDCSLSDGPFTKTATLSFIAPNGNKTKGRKLRGQIQFRGERVRR